MTGQSKSTQIINCMKDMGDDRHVGWWVEQGGLGEKQLLVEVSQHSVSISSCEGPRAEKRLTFSMSRQKGTEVARALCKALGLVVE